VPSPPSHVAPHPAPRPTPHPAPTGPAAGEPAISCRGLTRHFPGGTAVDHVDLDVAAGSVLALLGHNGAGKTTTIRLLDGVLAPHDGSATVLGLDPVRDGTALRRRTGVLTENAGLDDRLTARENLLATAAIRGLRGPSVQRRATDLLDRFGMGAHADQLCRGFSTGQRRRVAIARSLLHDPELLFLDEPTSGLDPAATLDVLALIAELARERGRTVVLCTHHLEEAGELADTMVVLEQGRVLVAGRPAELAAARWPGVGVTVDLGRPATATELELVAHLPRVTWATATPEGLEASVAGRDDVPALVAALAAGDRSVFGVATRTRGLVDVYFDVHEGRS